MKMIKSKNISVNITMIVRLTAVGIILAIIITTTTALSSTSDEQKVAVKLSTTSTTTTLSSGDITQQQQRTAVKVTGNDKQARTRRPSTNSRSRSATSGQKPVPQVQQQESNVESQTSPDSDALQKQLRLAISINSPPVFMTPTRDFYVDVIKHKPRAKITTIIGHDDDGDNLYYSLVPTSVCDASPYFSIDPKSGDVRLESLPPLLDVNNENKTFVGPIEEQQPRDEQEQQEQQQVTSNSQQDLSSSEQQQPGFKVDEEMQQVPFQTKEPFCIAYKLIVGAYDGEYKTNCELHIYIVNSSAPIVKGQTKLDRYAPAEALLEYRTKEFIESLYNLSAVNSSAVKLSQSFVNPTLNNWSTSSSYSPSLVTESTPSTTATSQFESTNSILDSNVTTNKSVMKIIQPFAQITTPDVNNNDLMQYGGRNLILVAFVFLFVGIVVSMMFILPLVRLKKRLKNIEATQHEQLSQRLSNESTVCSSSHHNTASVSQFTLNDSTARQFSVSPGSSSVHRQSSIDFSNTSGLPRSSVAKRVSMPWTAMNPIYIDQQQSCHQHHQKKVHHLSQNQHQQSELQSNIAKASQAHFNPNLLCNNIYGPLENGDDLYATINCEPYLFDHHQNLNNIETDKNQFISNCRSTARTTSTMDINQDAQIFDRTEAESPVMPESNYSLRSPFRLSSLPAPKPEIPPRQFSAKTLLERERNNNVSRQVCAAKDLCKTVARASGIGLEYRIDSDNRESKIWEIPRNNLACKEILGEGEFGQVYRCLMKQNEDSDKIVAVKSLKKSALNNERERKDLLAEIEIMKLVCDHPNVVKLLHCCTHNSIQTPSDANVIRIEMPIFLVMEYVELGKLQSYLRKCRPSVPQPYSCIKPFNDGTGNYNYELDLDEPQVTSKDLIKFMYHIAKGMEYVASKCIVHRDLASRNILISSDGICKVADFGMARLVNSLNDVYQRTVTSSHRIPVRWMAPEVLLTHTHSTKSDVFSFGILMWEIVTLGSTPYDTLTPKDVLEKVAIQGFRPERPHYCHQDLYSIMSNCWSKEVEERPTFGKLVEQLDRLLVKANDYLEIDQYPQHNYYNIPKTVAPNELF